MLYVLLRKLNQIYPSADFSVLSPNPVVVPSEVEDKVKFVKPKYFSVANELSKSSIFVIGGGTHLFDYGDKVKALKMQLRILILILYAKSLAKKVYLIGNGIGPLNTTWGKTLVRIICTLSDYISVRDRRSYDYLVNWKVDSKSSLAFDMAVLLNSSIRDENNLNRNEIKTLGISLTPVFNLYHNSKNQDVFMVNKISESINNWIIKDPQLEIRLFVFHGGSRDDDIRITKLLKEKLNSDQVKIIPYNPDPKSFLREVGYCDFFIGMKYHSNVFAYMNHLPLVIIEYHQKCRAFGEEIGLDHAIVSLDEVLDGGLEKYLNRLMNSPDEFISKLPLEEAKQRARHGFPKNSLV